MEELGEGVQRDKLPARRRISSGDVVDGGTVANRTVDNGS